MSGTECMFFLFKAFDPHAYLQDLRAHMFWVPKFQAALVGLACCHHTGL